jgi:ABC-type multidrug transport system fused ATPase/permease subunit
MRNDKIHHEEQHTSTVSSIKLILFFKKYFSSYKATMCATIILACFAIGSDLILPQLLKIALDSHITVSAQKLSFNNFSALPKVLLNEQKDLLVPTSNKNTFFIINEDLKAIPEDDLEILRERSFLSPEKYYYTERNLEIENIAQNNKELIFVTEKKVFITYENLKKLKKDEVQIIREKDFKGVVKITFYFICILVASFLFTFLQIFIVEFACQKIMHEIRIDIFKHIQSRSHAFFTSNPVGRLVTRATNDVQNLHEMFNAVFANILKDILLIFGIMGVLLWVNWKLALVCFSLIPVLIIASTFFSIQSRKAFRLVRIKIAAMNAKVQENITGIAVVKAFCREKINISSFNKLNNENYLANMKQTIIFAVFNPVVDGTRLFVTALIIWYGGGEALQDKITIGTLVLFLYYMRMFFRPIQDLAEKYNIIQSAFASLERIYLLMNNNERIDEPNNPLESKTNDGKIEFKNVSFRYNKDEPVLENISFTVEPGQTVAIVGLTGTGKSTVINLIERFYDIKSGQILIDGVDIQKMKKSFLRGKIGLVLQDIFLFAGTIRSNITLGNDSFTDDEIYSALKTANADHLVKKLPKGLDEDVMEGGKTLSTGERQLLSFARAVLINPRILILDEATSNIDPITEALIQNALENITQKRTSLVVAHRFSTIQKADRILVLHKGSIHESGTHDELMKERGLYFKLSNLQHIKEQIV